MILKRCHRLEKSQISLKSLSKSHHEANSLPSSRLRSTKDNSSESAVHRRQLPTKPTPNHNRSPLQFKVQRSIETKCATGSKNSLKNNSPLLFITSSQQLCGHTAEFTTCHSQSQADHSHNQIIKDLCKKIEQTEKKIVCYKDMVDRRRERHQKQVDEKLKYKEQLLENVMDLYLAQKQKNRRIMEQMGWTMTKQSPPRSSLNLSSLLESSEQKRRLTATFSFIQH